jgi:hypothetical protein
MVELSDQTTTSPSFRAIPYCPSSIRTVLMFVNSLIPGAPSSLPCPDHYTPPNENPRIRCQHAIDEHHSRVEFVDKFLLFRDVVAPGTGAQAEGLQNPFRKTRPAKQFFNQQRALRNDPWSDHYTYNAALCIA